MRRWARAIATVAYQAGASLRTVGGSSGMLLRLSGQGRLVARVKIAAGA